MTKKRRYNITPIQQAMDRQAWTLSELAERANVSVSTVKRTFELKTAHPQTVKQLVMAVGLTMEDVMAKRAS